MKLTVQKRLAATLFKSSPKRVWFDEDKLSDIKEAITKQDVKGLIVSGTIRLKPVRSISRGRARKIKVQKSKGMRKGAGSRKGSQNAGIPSKRVWIAKIRKLRTLLKTLKEKKMVTPKTYHDLYRKSKGGFFRNLRHLKLYIDEHNLIQTAVKKKTK